MQKNKKYLFVNSVAEKIVICQKVVQTWKVQEGTA